MPKPTVGTSPPESKGKGKAPATCKPPEDPLIHDYDSDDSDDGSFQRAFDTIHNMEKGVASISSIANPNPLPSSNSHQTPPTSDSESMVVFPGPTSHSDPVTPVVTEQATQSPVSDNDSELIVDIMERLYDEESLMSRIRRLQAKKSTSKKNTIKKPKNRKTTKKVRFHTPPSNNRTQFKRPTPRKPKSKTTASHPSKWTH